MTDGWHPDPTGRFELRLRNDGRWTSQVCSSGYLTSDPYDREPEPSPPPAPPDRRFRPLGEVRAVRIRKSTEDRGTVFEYVDLADRPVATVRQVVRPLGLLRRAFGIRPLRWRPAYAVADHLGRPAGTITRRPPGMRPTFYVDDPSGVTRGSIAAGRWRTRLRVGDDLVGYLFWSEPGPTYEVRDPGATTVGVVRRDLVDLDDGVADPLRLLALLAPVALDAVREQVTAAWAGLIRKT